MQKRFIIAATVAASSLALIMTGCSPAESDEEKGTVETKEETTTSETTTSETEETVDEDVISVENGGLILTEPFPVEYDNVYNEDYDEILPMPPLQSQNGFIIYTSDEDNLCFPELENASYDAKTEKFYGEIGYIGMELCDEPGYEPFQQKISFADGTPIPTYIEFEITNKGLAPE